MAGESPDKTEQQESSGTAAEERDPRFAVFRDPGADRGAGADSGATSDSATAVFRPRLPEDAARREPEAEPEPETKPEPEPEAKPVTERASEPESAAGVASTASGEAAASSEDSGVAEDRTGPDTDAEASGVQTPAQASAEGPADEPEAGDGRLRAAVAAWVDAAADDKPTADTESDADSEAGSEADADSDAKPETDGKDEPSATAEPEPEPEPEVGNASDLRGIDQPTAIFKAVKPAERVDQATTALKLPPRESKPGTKPESEAESTSTFVPLRSDDVRSAPTPRKPEPEPEPETKAETGPGAVPGPPVRTPETGSPASPAPAAPSWAAAERTRQQPLPPRPPLDLLAELTNTPPPPETPVRTAVRRVKIWTPLVLLLLIVFAIVQVMRPLPEPSLELTAKTSYTFEGEKPTLPWPGEGQGYMAATGLGTVDSFGEQKAVPIGSVAKAMTAYVVLKSHPLKRGEDGPKVPIDAKAEEEGKLDAQGESTLNTVKAGDTLTEQEALAAIMIPSANNIARLLARWDAGSEEAFVKKMNDTAKELGMENTTYTDPSGLNATTVSSAEDQVKLGQELVEIPALMDITKMPSWKDPSGRDWRNYNTLVPYNGALGIKTGSTTKAGGNLLFAAHKMVGGTDQLIVGAVLGQHKPPIIDTVNEVSKQVVTATQDLLEGAKIVKKGQVVGTVDDGFGRTVDVIAAKDVEAVGWPGLTVRLELTDDGRGVSRDAAAGTRVGTLTVGEGASQVKVPVTTGDELSEPSFGDKLTRIG